MNNGKTIYEEDINKTSGNKTPNAKPEAEPVKNESLELETNDDGNAKKRAAMLGAAVFGGGVIGAGASYLAGAGAAHAAEPATPADELKVTTEPDNLDFESAFNDARLTLGPGAVFRWHGGLYNTYTQEEWNNMSPEERAAFTARAEAMAQGSERDTYTYDHNNHEARAYYASNEKSEHQPTPKPKPNPDPEYKIEEEDHMKIGGEDVIGARVSHNGHSALLIDTDKDGVYDVAVEDLNDDGELQDNEVTDISSKHIKVQDQSLLDGNDSDKVEIIVGDDETVTTFEGHQVIANTATVNGHSAVIIDVNKDGTYDYAMVDTNDNGHLDGNDTNIQITSENIQVKDEALVDMAMTDTDLDPTKGMPDYINTASVHSELADNGLENETPEVDDDDEDYSYQNPESEDTDDEYAYQTPTDDEDYIENPDDDLPEDAIASNEDEATHDFTVEDPSMSHDGYDPYDPSDAMYDGSENV